MKNKYIPEQWVIRYVSHHELLPVDRDKIIALKQQHWPYSYQSQCEWMEQHIQPYDHHLMMEDNCGNLIAYLNQVAIDVVVDGQTERMTGVGNACVQLDYIGKGIGELLMQVGNFYLPAGGGRAILLCRKNLIPLYQRTGWDLFEGITLFQSELFTQYMMFKPACQAKQVQFNTNF